MRSRVWACGVWVTIAATGGCGGGPSEPPAENLRLQGVAKLDAMKQLAEALGKNDQAAINVAVETLTATNIDVKANPAEAKELVAIYKAKVQGRLKGDAAAQVKSVVQAVEQELP